MWPLCWSCSGRSLAGRRGWFGCWRLRSLRSRSARSSASRSLGCGTAVFRRGPQLSTVLGLRLRRSRRGWVWCSGSALTWCRRGFSLGEGRWSSIFRNLLGVTEPTLVEPADLFSAGPGRCRRASPRVVGSCGCAAAAGRGLRRPAVAGLGVLPRQALDRAAGSGPRSRSGRGGDWVDRLYPATRVGGVAARTLRNGAASSLRGRDRGLLIGPVTLMVASWRTWAGPLVAAFAPLLLG